MSDVSPVPDGYATVTPHLVVDDLKGALDFYARAFGATSDVCLESADGNPMHAEMKIGSSPVMLAPEMKEWGCLGPKAIGGSPCSMHLYVEDCDAVFETAVAAGAEVEMPPMDCFWGDRMGKVKDPFGHSWGIATHVADLSIDEIRKAGAQWFAENAPPQDG